MASSKLLGIAFRFIFFMIAFLNYIITVFYIWFPLSMKNSAGFLFLLYYNILFALIIWTVWTTAKSDPGQVPLYWGFYIGDPDSKRTRYCLMCNVFKPRRCHHCSVCCRCILNMDHHCPWINSCIGFYNRKYFIQMVFYLIIGIFSSIIANTKTCYNLGYELFKNKFELNWDFFLVCLALIIYIIDLIMSYILTTFLKFHIKLILENKTTIETLDHKGKDFQSEYDKGKWNNWIEVMGITKWLWFFPLKTYQGKPKGNGIDWGINEDVFPPSDRADINNINNNENDKNIELSEKLNNDQRESDITGITNTRNDISANKTLDRNHHHGSMSSLYQQ